MILQADDHESSIKYPYLNDLQLTCEQVNYQLQLYSTLLGVKRKFLHTQNTWKCAQERNHSNVRNVQKVSQRNTS